MSGVGDYKKIAATAQARREAAIPRDLLLPAEKLENLSQDVTGFPESSGHFNAAELEIISASVPVILDKIHSKSWTSTAVTKAFIKATVLAQQLTNCITEPLFDSAISRAAELDAHIQSTGKPVGPLHGLPISLKDCFITPPHPSSIGLAKFANTPTTPDQESILATLLTQAGAIIHVKTNVSPAMMAMESENNIWGRTLNPFHLGLSAGGSSGGEAALIAMRGSPIGIGTDIGGSIRLPAAFQHLYGLKPSYGRYSHFNSQSAFPGQETILSINGPLARHLESITCFSRGIVQQSSWELDPKVIPIPWRDEQHITPAGRPLRLAFMPHFDGLVTSHPPVQRALSSTRRSLEQAGHEVVDWDISHHPEIYKFLASTFVDFGGSAITATMGAYNEPMPSAMTGYAIAGRIPEDKQGFTASKMRDVNVRKNTYLRVMHEQRRNLGGIDGIIAPASAWAAPRVGATGRAEGKMHYPGYTAVWNVLDWPALTFPVLKADEKLDVARGKEWSGLTEPDTLIQADYDAAVYDGAPVSLQCIGERLQEEKLCEVVGIVDEALRNAGLGSRLV